MAGVPSSFISLRESVVRKPPMAGPKPTQATSTSMLARSTIGCSAVLNRLSSTRDSQALRESSLRDRVGGAVFGQLRAGQAAVELGAQTLETLQPWHDAHGPALKGCEPSFADHVAGAGGDAGNQAFELVQFRRCDSSPCNPRRPTPDDGYSRRPARRRCGPLLLPSAPTGCGTGR